MERQALKMNKGNLIAWTERTKGRLDAQIELARCITDDADKTRRLEAQNCKCCFYNSRIGGSAMTEQPCMCCHQPQMYGSTNTDALCMDCAKSGDLCKHCGGDIELRARRKQWPEPKA